MIKKYFFFSLAIIGLFAACDDNTNDTVVKLGAAPVITAPSANTAYVLNENTPDAVVDVITWTAADFGYSAATSYYAEFDLAGNNFADASPLGSRTSRLTFDDYTVGELNNSLLAKGIPFGTENMLEFRICATISDAVEQLCSEGVAFTVTPYYAEVIYPFLTVPGDYQNWTPSDENYKIFSRNSDENYSGYIYFTLEPTMYKFTKGLSWDINWGDTGVDGTLDPSGDNITAEEGEGLYQLNADLNTLTHSRVKTTWGVVGDATAGGWDTDTVMSWDGEKLTVTTDLTAGEIRFRANSDDAINLGDEFTNGILQPDAPNIPIPEAGNYTIDLYLIQGDYAYVLTKN